MRQDFVRSIHQQPTIEEDWGSLTWLAGRAHLAGSEQTFGLVRIKSGRRNPLHSHPNCEEILYVVSGACDHRLGEEIHRLDAGEMICIPRGVRHWARALGDEPLVAVISFSSPDRGFVSHEDECQDPP